MSSSGSSDHSTTPAIFSSLAASSSSPHGVVPSIAEPQARLRFAVSPSPASSTPSSISSSRSNSDADDAGSSSSSTASATPNHRLLLRPKLGRRQSSGSMIIPSNSSSVVRLNEKYGIDDARTMSPRRSSEEIERMGKEARQAMILQAKALQDSLLDIVDRVESIRSEHEKLEGGNRFLQSYIGELMQTSKITSAGAPKPKGKARAMK